LLLLPRSALAVVPFVFTIETNFHTTAHDILHIVAYLFESATMAREKFYI